MTAHRTTYAVDGTGTLRIYLRGKVPTGLVERVMAITGWRYGTYLETGRMFTPPDLHGAILLTLWPAWPFNIEVAAKFIMAQVAEHPEWADVYALGGYGALGAILPERLAAPPSP